MCVDNNLTCAPSSASLPVCGGVLRCCAVCGRACVKVSRVIVYSIKNTSVECVIVVSISVFGQVDIWNFNS